MRIHTVAALYVFVFSFFFPVSRTGYALLFLTFGSVITAELFNTVAEELSDMSAASFNPVVRIVKDMAAGAVLVCALFAIGVAVCIFWRPERFPGILYWFWDRPWAIALFAVCSVFSVLYVLWGPLGIRDRIHRKRLKRARSQKP